jgi:primosomal protein N'
LPRPWTATSRRHSRPRKKQPPPRFATRSRRGDRTVLAGVTGSGKTEVYLRAIAPVSLPEKGALVLVPEIALRRSSSVVFGRARDDVPSSTAATEKERHLMAEARAALQVAIGALSALLRR